MVNISWPETSDTPPMDLPDVVYALALVDELIERESEEGLLGEPDLTTSQSTPACAGSSTNA